MEVKKINNTAIALIVKLVITFVAALIAFTLLMDNPWSWILGVAVVATALNYLVGDLFVLPKYGNIIASIGDGIMAALVAYIASLISPLFQVTLLALLLFAVLIAVGEYFFHQYLQRSEKVEP